MGRKIVVATVRARDSNPKMCDLGCNALVLHRSDGPYCTIYQTSVASGHRCIQCLDGEDVARMLSVGYTAFEKLGGTIQSDRTNRVSSELH